MLAQDDIFRSLSIDWAQSVSQMVGGVMTPPYEGVCYRNVKLQFK